MGTAFGRNILQLRTNKKLTQQELADAVGVSRQSVYKWEAGEIEKPRQATVIAALMDYFGVTEQDLFGFSDGYFAKSTGVSSNIKDAVPSESQAPMLGSIAAGDSIEAIELANETHYVDPLVLSKHPNGFVLKVVGDSMDKVIPDEAYVYIAMEDVRSGDIAAVKVNGDEATIKRVRIYDEIVVLEPESNNPEHKKRIIDRSDDAEPPVYLLGKAVWMDSKLGS